MLEAAARELAAMPDEALAALTLEDMAILTVLREASAEQGGDLSGMLAQLHERWLGQYAQKSSSSAALHPLILLLVRALEENRGGALEPGEIACLLHFHALAGQCGAAGVAAELNLALGAFLPFLQEAQEKAGRLPSAELPELQRRIRYAFPEQIKQAPRMDAKIFAGVALPFRGPLLKSKCHLKIFGDVPEGAAVAVERGTCAVTGHVLGFLAAAEDCFVAGNVSGAVVCGKGIIRTNDIVDRATVIAKQGEVHCRRALGPRILFAQQRITVEQDVVRGTLVGQSIAIGGTMTGGQLHVAREAEAKHFAAEDNSPLDIVFRRTISCEDYGEALPPEAGKLLARTKLIRNRMQEYARMIVCAQVEAERYAGNALLYLCGGDRATQELAHMETMQRRLAFLERVIAGVDGLIQMSEDRYAPHGGVDAPASAGGESSFDMEVIEEECRALEAEGAIDAELMSRRDEVRSMHARFSKGRGSSAGLEEMRRLHDQSAQWWREHASLSKQLEHKQNEVSALVGKVALLDKASGEGMKLKVLQQLLSAAKSHAQSQALGRRANQPFMQVMLRHIQQRMQRIKLYQSRSLLLKEEYEKLAARLETENKVAVPKTTAQGQDAQYAPAARGLFDAGVRIYGDLHFYRAEVDPGLGHCRTEAILDAPAVFRRGNRGSVERR